LVTLHLQIEVITPSLFLSAPHSHHSFIHPPTLHTLDKNRNTKAVPFLSQKIGKVI
jgi:hypothetical protein